MMLIGEATQPRDPVALRVVEGELRVTPADGQEQSLAVNGQIDGWTLHWLGGSPDNPKAILEFTAAAGGKLLFWSAQEGVRGLIKPRPRAYDHAADTLLYGGHTQAEVLASAEDLLGVEVLAGGEPTYSHVASLLPPIRGRRYQVLGSPLSRGKYLIWPDGSLTTQDLDRLRVVYDPVMVDARIDRCTAYDGLLDDWMPIACYRFEGDEAAYDLIAFLLPEDYGVAPEPFIRLARYASADHTPIEEKVSWVQRRNNEMRPPDFYAALDETVRFWWRFEASLAHVELPEDRVWRWVKGSLALATVTFCDEHPKYGAYHYAREEHDTFPPTLLTLAETALAWGARDQAIAYLRYYLDKVVRTDGSFNYYGPSGTEYGQWLWLLDQTERWLGVQAWITRQLDRVAATGRLLEELRTPLGDSATRLIQIGAEADNRHEQYTYFSNNLWGVCGLRALADLMDRHGRPQTAVAARRWADSLAQDLQTALDAHTVDSAFGPLTPSHIGYPADMWTLSVGPTLPTDVPAWEEQAYWSAQHYVPKGYAKQQGAPRQWIRENTYANYRYHLESVAPMILDRPRAEALYGLRKARGGELLGMTRFMGWLDDWPVAAYARYLLTTERIDEYLLLFYSHMAHHGNRETLTYYEQVSIDGQVMADDCVPCLLVTPIMARWMLCFEPIGENALYLLRGIPRRWLQPGSRLSAQQLPAQGGDVALTVAVSDERAEVELTLPDLGAAGQVYLDLRLPGERALGPAISGGEWVAEIQHGYRLVIRPGVSGQIKASFALSA